jgi:hypothetical protein
LLRVQQLEKLLESFMVNIYFSLMVYFAAFSGDFNNF